MYDYWNRLNEEKRAKIEREKEYDKLRKRLAQELSIEDIVHIMFEQHLSKLSDNDIDKLRWHYLK